MDDKKLKAREQAKLYRAKKYAEEHKRTMVQDDFKEWKRGKLYLIRKIGPRDKKEAQYLRASYTVLGIEHYMWVSRMRSAMMIDNYDRARRIANNLDNCEVVAIEIKKAAEMEDENDGIQGESEN